MKHVTNIALFVFSLVASGCDMLTTQNVPESTLQFNAQQNLVHWANEMKEAPVGYQCDTMYCDVKLANGCYAKLFCGRKASGCSSEYVSCPVQIINEFKVERIFQ